MYKLIWRSPAEIKESKIIHRRKKIDGDNRSIYYSYEVDIEAEEYNNLKKLPQEILTNHVRAHYDKLAESPKLTHTDETE